MKVGQSLMVKKQLGNEKGLKEKMIHSVMPPKVADWLMREGNYPINVQVSEAKSTVYFKSPLSTILLVLKINDN